MVHKPKHKVHSFRGLLADGGQDEINLERQNLNVAYRINKFEVMGPDANTTIESSIKIYREKQSSVDGTINFSDPDLLAAAIYTQPSNQVYPLNINIVFDNTLFSRNIYVTHTETNASESCNYYIELEEVPVSASALMQLKLGVARKLNLEQ